MPGASGGFATSSKLLERKWQERTYKQHQEKMKQMKHGIDNKSPKKPAHLVLRLKKVQREEERQAEIEHNNRLLMQKMTHILRNKGRVDNWNEYNARSLRGPYKEKQQQKIAEENRGIAKRLETVKPLYDTDKWEGSYKRHLYYLELWDSTTKDYQITPRSQDFEPHYEDDFEDDDEDDRSRRLPKIGSRDTSHRRHSTAGDSKVTKLPKITNRAQEGLVESDCKALFKASKQLSRPEDALLRNLIRRNHDHRMLVKARFSEKYDLDLATELKNALQGKGYAALIDALLMESDEGDAVGIGDALQRNDPASALVILCMQDSKSLSAMNRAYKNKYDVTLEDDIKDRILDEDCQTLLLTILKGSRSDSADVDQKKARKDAQAILDAGSGCFTDEDGVFMQLVKAGNYAQLQATMKAYKQITGKDMTEAMKEDGCSKNFIKSVQKLGELGVDPAEYWADQIHAHLKPNDPELAKILVARAEDMPAIRKAYKKKYKQDLSEALEKKGGETGRYLVELSKKGDGSKAAAKDGDKSQDKKGQAGAKKADGKDAKGAQKGGQAKGKGKGTVKEDKDFSADDDIVKLHEAIKGWGTDEQALIDILSSCNNQQRQELKKKYKAKYDKDLMEEMKSELSGDLEELVLALLMPPVEYDAYCLHDAVQGLGTNETTLIGILCSRNAKELSAISKQYKEAYGKELKDDVMGDTSGGFQALLVQLLAGERDQGTSVDQDQARKDAEALYNDGQMDLNDETFKDIVCKKNKSQVIAIFKEFEKLAGKPIEEAVKEKMGGDAEDAYLGLILAVRDTADFYATRLNDAMSGAGTNDNQLIRIIVTRSEIDLADIKAKYKEKYGKTLAEAIDSDTSGDYKKLLLALVKDK